MRPRWMWLTALIVFTGGLWWGIVNLTPGGILVAVCIYATMWALTSERAATQMVEDPDRSPTRDSIDGLARLESKPGGRAPLGVRPATHPAGEDGEASPASRPPEARVVADHPDLTAKEYADLSGTSVPVEGREQVVTRTWPDGAVS